MMVTTEPERRARGTLSLGGFREQGPANDVIF